MVGKRQALEGHKAYRGRKEHKGRVIALSILAAIVVTVIIHGISAATLDRWVDYKEITFTSPPSNGKGYVRDA